MGCDENDKIRMVRMKKEKAALAVSLILAVIVSGCVQYGGTPAPKPTSPVVALDSSSISVFHTSVTPASVTIKKGGTVTWTNQNTMDHSIVSDDNKFATCELLNAGQTCSLKFSDAGSFKYHLRTHLNVKGTVVVTE